MFTRDDLIDALVAHLGAKMGLRAEHAVPGTKPGECPSTIRNIDVGGPKEEMLPAGRRFISDYDLKKRLKPGSREVTIERGSIISPLALEWLELEGIRVFEK